MKSLIRLKAAARFAWQACAHAASGPTREKRNARNGHSEWPLLRAVLIAAAIVTIPAAWAGSQGTTVLNGAAPRPFYVFAHNPNTIKDIREALTNGCNALEPDITVKNCNGQDLLIDFDEDLGVPNCSELQFIDWCKEVHNLATAFPQLALVAIDIKSKACTPEFGAQIMEIVRNHLNTNGVDLNIIYSVSDHKYGAVFDQIIDKLGPREGVQIDQEDSPGEVVQYFFDRGYNGYIGYGDGTTFQGPDLPRAIDRAAYLRASIGYPQSVTYVYTLSEPESMESFINAGVDGIIVTDGSQKQLAAIVQSHREIRLATRDDNPFQPQLESYAVQVQTASGLGAGTDADIQFTINGCRGSATITVNTGSILPLYDSARMRSGNQDWITIPSKDLGDLQSITIKNLGGGANGNDWDLVDVHVSSARYIGPDIYINNLPSREYSAVFNGTVTNGGTVVLPLAANYVKPLPTIQCPSPIMVAADAKQCGATVQFSPQVAGLCDDVTAVCNPPSGSFFPVGHTTVTCWAQAATNSSAPCSFRVSVLDTEPPVITCPAPLVVNAATPAGAMVVFTPAAADNCSIANVQATPSSGSTFPIGNTTVFCLATDAAANQASCNFNIHVKGAAEQAADLLATVNGLGLSRVLRTALLAHLQSALASIASHHDNAACGQLEAFINLVQAKQGKGLSPADATNLINAAAQIRAVLGC